MDRTYVVQTKYGQMSVPCFPEGKVLGRVLDIAYRRETASQAALATCTLGSSPYRRGAAAAPVPQLPPLDKTPPCEWPLTMQAAGSRRCRRASSLSYGTWILSFQATPAYFFWKARQPPTQAPESRALSRGGGGKVQHRPFIPVV